MKWVEVITVRAIFSSAKTLASTLQELMKDVARKSEHEPIRIYRRQRIDTGFCVVLSHEGQNVLNGGSRLGLRLVAALKDFGLINHSLWNEIDRE